ncbi:hypothetical protein MKW94_013147 [Papaver nudicaule]|uniref:Uncharacterized protein n=1 Tax=Papaver nudicaule TaxID=74823 RepID=A0AA41S6M1_PAPNU|nr:hypothetical protein [Papaver nudicaule]
MMATKSSPGFFTVLLFFAIVNMSQTAFAKWNITGISPLSRITGEEICKSGDTYDAVDCGPTRECKCCKDWCEDKCHGMSSSVDTQKCTKYINSEGYPTTACECCCTPPSQICKPGDIHDAILCGPTRECNCCIDWCEDKCRGMGSSVDTQKCTKFINSEGYPTTTCDCCCRSYATTTLKLSRSSGGSISITG